MSTTEHPFARDRLEAVAGDRDVDAEDLDEVLTRVQRAIAKDESDTEYEYSSQHNFGWEAGDAYYLYGDGIWETLGDELDLSDDHLAAAREVHRRTMLESAAERDERESVEEMFDDGTEPLVVTSTARDPPLYGQDV
jgi:hypothetical protein